MPTSGPYSQCQVFRDGFDTALFIPVPHFMTPAWLRHETLDVSTKEQIAFFASLVLFNVKNIIGHCYMKAEFMIL